MGLLKAIIRTLGKNKCPDCTGELKRLKHWKHITGKDNAVFLDKIPVKEGKEFTFYYKCKICGHEFSFDQVVNGDE